MFAEESTPQPSAAPFGVRTPGRETCLGFGVNEKSLLSDAPNGESAELPTDLPPPGRARLKEEIPPPHAKRPASEGLGWTRRIFPKQEFAAMDKVLHRAWDFLRVLSLLVGVYLCGVVDGVSLHRCFFFLRNCSTILKRTLFCFFINGLFAAAAVAAGQLVTPLAFLSLKLSLRFLCALLWSSSAVFAALLESGGSSLERVVERATSALAASCIAADSATAAVGGYLEALLWIALKLGLLYPVYLLSSFYFDVAEHGLALLAQEEALRRAASDARAEVRAAGEALRSPTKGNAGERTKASRRLAASRRQLESLLSEPRVCAACRMDVASASDLTMPDDVSLLDGQGGLGLRGGGAVTWLSGGGSRVTPDALLLRPVLQYVWWAEAALLLPLVPVLGSFLAALNAFWMTAFWSFDRKRRGRSELRLRCRRLGLCLSASSLLSPTAADFQESLLTQRRGLAADAVAAASLPTTTTTPPPPLSAASSPDRQSLQGCTPPSPQNAQSLEAETIQTAAPHPPTTAASAQVLFVAEEAGDAAAALERWLCGFERHWFYFAGFGTPGCLLLQLLHRAGADTAELAAAAVFLPLSILLALRASPRRSLFANTPEQRDAQLRLLGSFPLLDRMPIFAFVHVFADLAAAVLGAALFAQRRGTSHPTQIAAVAGAGSAHSEAVVGARSLRGEEGEGFGEAKAARHARRFSAALSRHPTQHGVAGEFGRGAEDFPQQKQKQPPLSPDEDDDAAACCGLGGCRSAERRSRSQVLHSAGVASPAPSSPDSGSSEKSEEAASPDWLGEWLVVQRGGTRRSTRRAHRSRGPISLIKKIVSLKGFTGGGSNGADNHAPFTERRRHPQL